MKICLVNFRLISSMNSMVPLTWFTSLTSTRQKPMFFSYLNLWRYDLWSHKKHWGLFISLKFEGCEIRAWGYFYSNLIWHKIKCELFEHLNSVIRLRETDAKIAAQQLFVAIEELHRRNIIHRDIKLVRYFFFAYHEKRIYKLFLRKMC